MLHERGPQQADQAWRLVKLELKGGMFLSTLMKFLFPVAFQAGQPDLLREASTNTPRVLWSYPFLHAMPQPLQLGKTNRDADQGSYGC